MQTCTPRNPVTFRAILSVLYYCIQMQLWNWSKIALMIKNQLLLKYCCITTMFPLLLSGMNEMVAEHSGASQATQLLLIQAMQTWYWCNLGDKFNAKEQLFNSSRMAKWSKALSSWPIDCRFESCLGILHFFPIFPNFRVLPGVWGTSGVRGNLPIIT